MRTETSAPSPSRPASRLAAAVWIVAGVIALVGALAALGVFDAPFTAAVARFSGKAPAPRWAENLHRIGLGLALASLAAAAGWSALRRGRARLEAGRAALDSALARAVDAPLGRAFTLGASAAPAERAAAAWTRADTLVALGFALFAALFFLARLQESYPLVLLGGDGGNIASFAAAWDNPARFTGDALLGNLDNIRVYNTLHIPLIRWLQPPAGNYGLAYAWLLGPHVFLQLLGFYLLGRVLFKSRYWALLLAALTAAPWLLTMGEFWGLANDPLPRFTYQAALPFLLALVFHWQDRPSRWPIIMIAAGLLFYAHPVSAPTWGFAIWLGLWLLLPRGWGFWRRLGVMAGLGVVFLLAASPFVVAYLSNHVQGQVSDYETILYIVRTYFPANLLHPGAALVDFLRVISEDGLPFLALAGLVVLLALRRGASGDRRLGVLLAWLAGLLVVAVLVPAVERTVERYLRMAPIETELLRGLRYTVPLLLLLALWALRELSLRARDGRVRAAFALAGLLFVGLWLWRHPFPPSVAQAAGCLAQGETLCPANTHMADAVRAVQSQTPEGACLFAYNDKDKLQYSYGLEARYLALRPLVHSFKDRGLLAYSNSEALIRWFEVTRTLQDNEQFTPEPGRIAVVVETARSLGAEYLLLDNSERNRERLVGLGADTVYANPGFLLLDLNNPASCRTPSP